MIEHNTCKSSELSLADAEKLDLADQVNVPPAPSLTGVWLTPDGQTTVLELLDRSEEDGGPAKGIMIGTTLFDYENDLNEAIVAGARRAELFEHGYALRWSDATEWRRRKEDVLCFVKGEVFEGVVPKMERTLKLDRKAAKKKMAEAEAAGDEGTRTFFDNLQNAIKVLMNGARALASSTRCCLIANVCRRVWRFWHPSRRDHACRFSHCCRYHRWRPRLDLHR
jgi:DNA polymerase elongation subunit (family B)